MSKYDQMSNWHNRPLRKAQMHYAALDAVVVLVLFEKLKEEIHSRVSQKILSAQYHIRELMSKSSSD